MSVERDSGNVCRFRKCLFREKERERERMCINLTIGWRVCVSIEGEKRVYKERECVCV